MQLSMCKEASFEETHAKTSYRQEFEEKLEEKYRMSHFDGLFNLMNKISKYLGNSKKYIFITFQLSNNQRTIASNKRCHNKYI